MKKISKKSLWKSCEKFVTKFVIFYGKNLEKKFVKKMLKFRDKLWKNCEKFVFFDGKKYRTKVCEKVVKNL